MAEQQRVTFRFGRDTEVHYVDRLPAIGDRVTRGRELWVVTRVEGDDLGMLVICERSERGVSTNGGRVESLV
jgi:hypothetical protein